MSHAGSAVVEHKLGRATIQAKSTWADAEYS
jgi:hypothetical protein